MESKNKNEITEIKDRLNEIFIEIKKIDTKLSFGYTSKDEFNTGMGQIHSKINRTVIRLFLLVACLSSALSGLVAYIIK